MGIETLFDGEAGGAWKIFSDICKIPRPSKHEERIRQWLLAQADAYGWETRKDNVGNIVTVVPGRGALAGANPLALQGHMDMVCEKNSNTDHDFLTDPIRPYIDGDWMRAKGTTLGADNGVAIALAMAVAADDMPDRMPLELLFTIDEETGLSGALGLDPASLSARQLLNLDSEEDGVFIIGCVGGIDLLTEFQCRPIPENVLATQCTVTGFRGGHSGVNIHEGRTNAILFAASILEALGERQLLAFAGGSKKNAIPREASFTVAGDCHDELARIVESRCLAIRKTEPGVNIKITVAETENAADIPWQLVDFLSAFPNGILEVEEDFPEVVRTSNSLGVAQRNGNTVRLLAHGRSSTAEGRAGIAERVRKLATTAGGTVSTSGDYPGWAPSSSSRLLKHGKRVYQEIFGTEPTVEAIHAGLEAGIIGDKIGTHELLAYGPTIRNAHSPDECLSIASFNRAYRLLKAFVSTPVED